MAKAKPRSFAQTPPHFPTPGKARRNVPVISRDAVLKSAYAQDSQSSKYDKQILDLPELHDLGHYGISHAERNELWECEIDRLLESVSTLTKPVLPKTDYTRQADKKGFSRLSQLADQMLINTHICRLDNQLVFHESNSGLSGLYSNSYRILEGRVEKLRSAGHHDHNYLKSVSFLQEYCGLVDYISAVLVRIAVTATTIQPAEADADCWHADALANVAKYAAKMKILVMKPKENVIRAFERGKRLVANKSVLDRLGSNKKSFFQSMASNGMTPGLPLSGMQYGRFPNRFNRGQKGRFAEAEVEDVDDDQPQEGGFQYPYPYGGWGADPLQDDFGPNPAMYGMGGIGNFYQHTYDLEKVKELEAFLVKKEEESGNTFLKVAELTNKWVSGALLSIIQGLKASVLTDLPGHAFDICSIVYETGLAGSGLPVLLHQDRAGELQGVSNLNHVKLCFAAFELIEQEVKALRSLPARKGDVGVHVQCHLRPKIGVPTVPISAKVSDIVDVAKLIVVLYCTSPSFLLELRTVLTKRSELLSLGDEGHQVPDVPEYTAVVSLSTKSFEEIRGLSGAEKDYKSLTWSFLGQQHDRPLGLDRIQTDTWAHMSNEQKSQKAHTIRARQEELVALAADWVFQEDAIVVGTARYVYTVMAICTTLVIGGLMLGIFVGTFRGDGIALKDVDPFGFTTYAWVVAGFIMVIAKSVRVVEWPWRDFLLRRVTCRSLSELRSVTGTDEQDLLVLLLAKEYENVLITKGPYNELFTRRANAGSQGFSIDRKPEIRTLFAAGIIFVKVSMNEGTALVSLDLRMSRAKNDKGRASIRHKDNFKSSDIMCRYPPRASDTEMDVNINQNRLGWQMFIVKWDRILGIYHAHDRKVR